MTQDHDSSMPSSSRPEQHRQAAQSPVKTPHQETAHVPPQAVQHAVDERPQDAARAPASGRDHEQDTAPSASTSTPTPTSSAPPTGGDQDPLPGASARVRSVDVLNSGTTDSTVDTDAKGLDAQRRRPGEDHDIASNATLDNAVPTSDTGLAGFDSRARDRVATSPGTRLVDEGWESVRVTGNVPPEAVAHGDAWRDRPEHAPHVAVNHGKRVRTVRLEPALGVTGMAGSTGKTGPV